MEIFNQVVHFQVFEDKVYYIGVDHVVSDGKKSFPIFSTPWTGFEIFNNRIYINDWELKYLIFDLDLNLIEKGDNKRFAFSNHFFLISNSKGSGSIQKKITDLNNNEILISFSKKGNYFIVNQNNLDLILYFNKTNLCLILNNSPNPIWNFNLESLGKYIGSIGTFIDENGQQKEYEINKFLGVYENEILLALSGEMILALDLHSGTVSRKWQREKILKPSENPDFPTWVTDYPVWQMIDSSLFPPNYNWVSNMNPSSNCFQLDILSQMLYSLFGEYWVAIDLKNGESTFQSLKDTLVQNHIKRFRASFGYGEDLNYVYTIGEMDEKFFNTDYIPQCLVAVNKETKQLDWVYRFENDGINLDIPQVTEDKVYQLSAGKNLYIFDKSEFNGN